MTRRLTVLPGLDLINQVSAATDRLRQVDASEDPAPPAQVAVDLARDVRILADAWVSVVCVLHVFLESGGGSYSHRVFADHLEGLLEDSVRPYLPPTEEKTEMPSMPIGPPPPAYAPPKRTWIHLSDHGSIRMFAVEDVRSVNVTLVHGPRGIQGAGEIQIQLREDVSFILFGETAEEVNEVLRAIYGPKDAPVWAPSARVRPRGLKVITGDPQP